MAKQPKKKGFKRFFLCLLIFVAVLSGLILWGLSEFWKFIDAYEVSQPKNAIVPFVEQLSKEEIAESDVTLMAQIDPNLQSKEAVKQFILDTLTDEITYARNISESGEDKLIYMLMHKGTAIGKATLKPDPADKYGFTAWTAEGAVFDFSYLMGSAVTVTVPHDFTVYANGIALDENYITEKNIPYEELADYYADYTPPYMVTYSAGPILGEIQLTFRDRDGNEVIIDEETDLSEYRNNCTESEMGYLDSLLTPFLKSYVSFTSNEGGKDNSRNNYNSLIKYLVPNGAMASRMYNALDGLYWAKDSGSEITEVYINSTVNLGGGRYLCDVTYIVEAEVYREDPITVNDVKIMVTETAQGLRVESLEVS